MTDVILQCDPFNQKIGTENFCSNSEFTLSSQQIGILYGLSKEMVDEFLYFIGGLQNIRGLTMPAKTGRLIRQDVQTPTAQLRFIKLFNKPLYEYSNLERAKHISFVFENPDLFIIGNTVSEDFQYSFNAIKKEPPPLIVLEKYGLLRKTEYKTEVLSGGERHRLNCAAVLETVPNLVIADLSNSNLDGDFTDNLIEWLQDFAWNGGAVFLTGLPEKKFTRILPIPYVLEQGEFVQKRPDLNLFPDSDSEKTTLETLLDNRDIGNKSILEVKSLSLRPRMPIVTFSLKERDILIIQGPNGSGKTTLGKILTKRIRTGIDGTFQHGSSKPIMSLQYPDRFFVMNSVQDELSNEQLLDICGITENEQKMHPRKLPRAQQKLLSLAIALERSEGYAILDEPTSGMDFPAKKKFIGLLNHFKEKAILIITHDASLLFPSRTTKWGEIVRV
jgi:energy-coupling factor transport system ATP-binding protein